LLHEFIHAVEADQNLELYNLLRATPGSSLRTRDGAGYLYNAGDDNGHPINAEEVRTYLEAFRDISNDPNLSYLRQGFAGFLAGTSNPTGTFDQFQSYLAEHGRAFASDSGLLAIYTQYYIDAFVRTFQRK